MRRLTLPIIVAVLCAGCGVLPWADDNTGLACQRVASAPDGADRDALDPLAPGEALEGLDVTSMTAAQVGDAAVDAGLEVTWRFTFDIGEPNGHRGYSECWCVPPPAGSVSHVVYVGANSLIVFVDSGEVLAAPRGQPREGWGCPEVPASGSVVRLAEPALDLPVQLVG